MANTTKSVKSKRKRRAVAAEDGIGVWQIMESVTQSRSRIKPEFARALYSLARILADEHDTQRDHLLSVMKAGTMVGIERHEYHRHASSALRMLSDRLLKTFDTFRLLGNAKTYDREFRECVERLSKQHAKRITKAHDGPSLPESY